MSRTVAIIQARLGSRRLPGKTLMPLAGHPMLWHIIQRLKTVPALADICVATPENVRDIPLRAWCREEEVVYYAGSEHDVLDRYYHAAIAMEADVIVRVTADCPCIMPSLVSQVIAMRQDDVYALAGAATGAGAYGLPGNHFPDGVDVECCTFACLERLWKVASAPQDREHVSTYAFRNPDQFAIGRVYALGDYGHHRWTVDHLEDYQLVAHIYDALYSENVPFILEDVLGYLETYPDVYALNRHYVGQEGYAALVESP